jgi:hypothetical protein
VLTLRGWIHGLGGAAAITIGLVVAALVVAGLTAFHGGDGHVKVPDPSQRIALGADSGMTEAVSASAGRQHTRTSSGAAHGRKPASRVLAGTGGGPVSVRHGESRAPAQSLPGPGEGSHNSSAPVDGAPSASTPQPGGGNPGSGGGGDPVQRPSSLGGAVQNTTQQLGDTVNGVTQTVGNTVGAVSPALGNTVNQTGSALNDTVKGTGDVVGHTLDGLLGGHH